MFGFVMYDSHFWNHVSEKCPAFEIYMFQFQKLGYV